MQTLNRIPDWDYFSENLRNKLGYSDATLERTKSTYNDFVRNYCALEGGDAETAIIQGISKDGADIGNRHLLQKFSLRIIDPAVQRSGTGKQFLQAFQTFGYRHGKDCHGTLLFSIFL